MNFATIRRAMGDAINAIPTLKVVQMGAAPLPPCCVIYPQPPFPYDLAFDGTQMPRFTVLVIVPATNAAAGQDQLDGFLSTGEATSIKDALETDTNLKTVVSDIVVNHLTGYEMREFPSGDVYLTAELSVEIYA